MQHVQNQATQHSEIDRTCHALRGPLAVVHAYVEHLDQELSGELNEGQRELVETIMRAAGQLSDLVNNLGTAVRTDGWRPDSSARIADINQVCRDLVRANEESFADAGIEFALQLQDEEPVPVPVDLERLRLSLGHLINNARKYTPAGRSVAIEVGADLDRAWIHVRDTGAGIHADDLERIFEMNERSGQEPAEDGESEAGIGLTLSRSNLESMGATLTVESTLGLGSCFSVEFDLTNSSLAN